MRKEEKLSRRGCCKCLCVRRSEEVNKIKHIELYRVSASFSDGRALTPTASIRVLCIRITHTHTHTHTYSLISVSCTFRILNPFMHRQLPQPLFSYSSLHLHPTTPSVDWRFSFPIVLSSLLLHGIIIILLLTFSTAR